MRAFAQLFRELDESNRTSDKVRALVQYFEQSAPRDAAWAVWFLVGNKLELRIPTRRLRTWVSDLTGHPAWLVETCYERVGDLAETVALLLPETNTTSDPGSLADVVEDRLLPLAHWDDTFQFGLIRDFWASLGAEEAFVVNKMMTGGFRVGVSKNLVIRALAKWSGLDKSVIAHRLTGNWEPTAGFFESLRASEDETTRTADKPYPFFLASPLESSPDHGEAPTGESSRLPARKLSKPEEWAVEWKWDGIRAQLSKRDDSTFLWSRGDEMLTDSFPEIVNGSAAIPNGTVLDGEILCWKGSAPLPFHFLQTRIRRKKPTANILKEAPALFLAYDCLEQDGTDIREQPWTKRRAAMEKALRVASSDAIASDPVVPEGTTRNRPENTLRVASSDAIASEPGFPRGPISFSPLIDFSSWNDLGARWDKSRERGVEGMILKRRSSPYRTERVKGDWWKWKIDPMTADLVLIYAQAGHGRRANLFTDYTLAARDGDQWVPVAKAYSGLTKEEIGQLDRWIKRNTVAKRGPVRTVPPEQVLEIGFEGIRPSNRHKSGLAMRFPRILRWRRDKPASEASSIGELASMV